MKKKRKLLVALLTISMVLAMMPSMAFAAAAKSGDIVVLFTNDTHCEMSNGIGFDGLAAYKAEKEMQVGKGNVTLVDAGDAVQGDIAGTLSKGQYAIDSMNQVGYDIAVPGNHEFDYGIAQFKTLIQSANASYICSNFTDLQTGKPVLDGYKIMTYGNTKVAYVGIATPESITKSTPVYFQDANGKYIYDFANDKTGRKLYSTVQTSVDAAKTAGADYVIAVGHLGIVDQSKPWTSRDVISNTTGIDAFIDGHSHSVLNETVKNKSGKSIPLGQTGTKFENIGEMVIGADGNISIGLIKSADYTTKDPATKAFLQGINDKLSALTSKVVATSLVDLTTIGSDGKWAIRREETNLGNFCADSFKFVGNADIGLIQGGGIRADVKAGDITYGDILKLYPFGNNMCVAEATGRQLLDMLEMAARTWPDDNGGFMHVSGITFEIDSTVASTVETSVRKEFIRVKGARRVVNVKVNGVAIDPAKIYRVASTEFTLLQGGDGMTMFKGCKTVTEDPMADTEVISTYINAFLKGTIGTEYAKPQGRIKILTEVDKAPLKEYKAATTRTTKINSAKASSGRIKVAITGNSKAYGFYYRTINSKGKIVSLKTSPSKSYLTKKLAKGKYTVKVTPYTYVLGEKIYGKITNKIVTIR